MKSFSQFFREIADRVTIWCADIEYVQEFDQLNNLAKNLEKQVDIGKIVFVALPFGSGNDMA